MEVIVANDPKGIGILAGTTAANAIRAAVKKNGQANIIVATGDSQIETLKQLISENIDWSKVVVFHLDEYIDLPESSPASFRKYLKERLLNQIGAVKEAYFINGEVDPYAECERLGRLIAKYPIDVALVGIGENGHLAFNDPPADFDTGDPYIVVSLDEACRMQQVNEGWFKSLSDVPLRAISMSVKQVLKSGLIVCSAPDSRKARAIKDCLERPVDNRFPASILQLHPNCTCFLDKSSAALLTRPFSMAE